MPAVVWNRALLAIYVSARALHGYPWSPPRPRQDYVNVRLIVPAVGVNASATGAKATCVACRARAGGLRSG